MPLGDGDEIRNLLGRYCDLIDAGDFEGVGGLFAEGTLADDRGRPLAAGAEAVAAFYAGSTRRHGATPRTKHVVANTVLEEGDDGSITARSSYLVLQATDDLPFQPIITGRYVDRFERGDDGRWRFAERRFFVDLHGELGHHLNLPLD